MTSWPSYPSIYEINTWVWLSELTKKAGRAVDLGSVPASEWDAIAALGFDAVWFMGVWERSPAGTAIANRNDGLLADFRRALPDFTLADNVGSPYCVRRYLVDPHLGGPDGLAAARAELARRSVRLVLDFVPNHVAPDHPWASEHPTYFIRGNADDLRNNPAAFLSVGREIFACGRDPYFPAWPDVLQLNAFDPGLRNAVRGTVSHIANQCDGIRCDMAMLLLNAVFARTWGERAGAVPPTDYWKDVIPAVKQSHPDFLFIAEAYWDLEFELQQQGFDFCYDKRLYDRLEHDNAESVRLHLCADPAFQNKLVRFLENHDEPRAAAAFSGGKARAAAVLTSTLPGARLFHEGQFEGRTVRVPVFLARRPDETLDADLRRFYETLLRGTNSRAFRAGRWTLCERAGWPDNSSFQNLVAWQWECGDERFLIVVNLSAAQVQARVVVTWNDVTASSWVLRDTLSGRSYERSGADLRAGLYVDLAPWTSHLFDCQRGRKEP